MKVYKKQLDLLLPSPSPVGGRFVLLRRPRKALNSRTPRAEEGRGEALKIEIE